MKFSDLTEAERGRLAVAFHEAGHAIAAVLAGGHIAEVVLTGDPETPGRCTYSGVSADAERGVTYAGAFAEVRHHHGPYPPLVEIRAALSGTCDGEALTATGGLAREVEPLLSAVWPAVRTLAADLFRDGRAGHDAVLAALGAASDADMPLITSLIKSKLWTAPAA